MAKAKCDMASKTTSTFRQVLGGKYEPLDPHSGHNPLYDLRHVCNRDPAVKK